MQIYAGLNPFLQSVNSPINGKNFISPTSNYPVEGDSINVNPLTVPPYANPNQSLLSPMPPVLMQSSIAGGGFITAPMLGGAAVGTVNLDSEVNALFAKTNRKDYQSNSTFEAVPINATQAGTTVARVYLYRGFGAGTAEMLYSEALVSFLGTPSSYVYAASSEATTTAGIVSALEVAESLGTIVTSAGDVLWAELTASLLNQAFDTDGGVAAIFIGLEVNGTAKKITCCSMLSGGNYAVIP